MRIVGFENGYLGLIDWEEEVRSERTCGQWIA